MSKLEALKKQYQKAVSRLEEVLEREKNEVVRDSAIKRFEFTFDLAWKLIKAYLQEEKGVSCASPKECFRQAYRTGLINYDEFWLKMTELRNQAVHTYSEKFADSFYEKLPGTLEYFQLLEERIL